MTDEQLLKLSGKIDTFLVETATEYQTPALALSAVILARLLIVNGEAKSDQDFKSLLGIVSETPVIQRETQPIH